MRSISHISAKACVVVWIYWINCLHHFNQSHFMLSRGFLASGAKRLNRNAVLSYSFALGTTWWCHQIVWFKVEAFVRSIAKLAWFKLLCHPDKCGISYRINRHPLKWKTKVLVSRPVCCRDVWGASLVLCPWLCCRVLITLFSLLRWEMLSEPNQAGLDEASARSWEARLMKLNSRDHFFEFLKL